MTQPQTARKTFVVDTSVLLSTPRAILTFAEHEVVLPLVVLKELASKRSGGRDTDPELAHSAREALRLLDSLVEAHPHESLRNAGITVNDLGGTVRVEINHVEQSGLPDALVNDRTHDTRILAVAKNLASEGRNVTLVSKDLPLRLLAEVVGLSAQDYLRDQIKVEQSYTGVVTQEVDAALIDALYVEKVLPFGDGDPSAPPLNTAVVLKAGSQSALTRVALDSASGKTVLRLTKEASAYGIKGRSLEQKIALAHLLNPEVGIVSLGGNAGTGKSMLALAAALEAVVERRTHKSIVVFRPLFAVGGQDLGFLPGTEEEKMGPWGGAVFDALKAIGAPETVTDILARKALEVLPLTHIRGRTFTDSIVIIDEAQNLERRVLLSALSRLGENSRVFLTHDIAQRDNLHVGRYDGIAAVVERLKGRKQFAHVTLTKSERSEVAALVAEVLDDFE